MVPTSRSRAPVLWSRSGMRNPSPISTISPRLRTISRPRARAVAARTRAAALLLVRWTASAPGTASARADRAPVPRRARRPVARSNSTSVGPEAARSASRAASESGARPRLVWITTPVALRTGSSEAAVGGRAATVASAARSGANAPRRTRSWASATARRTRSRPNRSAAATSRGSASSASVRGTRRLASVIGWSPTEAYGNRTHPAGIPDRIGVEDREGHQAPARLRRGV